MPEKLVDDCELRALAVEDPIERLNSVYFNFIYSCDHKQIDRLI